MTTELKLVKWYDAGFPPIDLNENVSAVTELIREVKRLEEITKAADKSINKFGELITAVHVAVEKSGAKILLTDSEIVEKLVNESSDLLTEYRLKSKLPSGI